MSSPSGKFYTHTKMSLQSKVKVEVRTCKHLKELLGETYEIARIAIDKATKSASKPSTSASGTLKSRVKPASTSKLGPRTTRSGKRKALDEDELPEDDDEKPSTDTSKDAKNQKPTQNDTSVVAGDELAQISGIEPKTYLRDGEEREVKSLTRYVLESLFTLGLVV